MMVQKEKKKRKR
jgi:hypothetical protein